MNKYGKKIYVLLIAVVISCSFAAFAAKGESVEEAAKESPVARKIVETVEKRGNAFIYFYSTEYETSIGEAGRIAALAEKEKAGFVKVNINDAESASLARTYSLTYVPTVIHIKKGVGIVEQFAGPKNLKRLTADRKIRVTPHEKELVDSAKNGQVTFLEFYADWCNPCVEQMPKLAEAEKSSNGKLKVLRLHVDSEPEMVALYNVDGPPTNIILDRNGIPRLRTKALSSPETVFALLNKLGII